MKALFEKEFWQYSDIKCLAYPLEGLDTVDSDGKIAWNAALSYIVNGDTDDHLDMLDIDVVARLLEDKWSTYAQVCQHMDRRTGGLYFNLKFIFFLFLRNFSFKN
jgi:hypothetical protein